MFRINLKIISIFSLLVLSTATQAQTMTTEKIMEISSVTGNVLAERIDGSQYPVRTGSLISHGTKIMLTTGSRATGIYLQSRCEVAYRENTVVNVRKDLPCAPGVAVIDASKYAKFGNSANPGCCVTKTITVPGTAIVKPAVPITTTSDSFLGSAATPLLIAGGIGVLLLLNDDDDSSSVINPPTPVSL